MLNFSILTENFPTFMEGFYHTVIASVLGLIGSFLIGTVIAVFRIAPFKPFNWIGAAYVEIFRNIPLLLIVYGFFLGLPAFGIVLNGFISGTLGLTVYTAAFIAEAIRAGILAVPQGQMEAARSSGLTYIQTMRHIVLPQAIKIVIPPLSNQFLNLIKNSSILGVVAGLDLMYFGDQVDSDTLATFDTYIFVGLFYLVLTLPVSYVSRRLERRMAPK